MSNEFYMNVSELSKIDKSEIEDYASEIKELKAKTVDSEKAIQDAISKKEEELKQKYADKEKEFKEMQKIFRYPAFIVDSCTFVVDKQNCTYQINCYQIQYNNIHNNA